MEELTLKSSTHCKKKIPDYGDEATAQLEQAENPSGDSVAAKENHRHATVSGESRSTAGL
jgi:hypothetical protein